MTKPGLDELPETGDTITYHGSDGRQREAVVLAAPGEHRHSSTVGGSLPDLGGKRRLHLLVKGTNRRYVRHDVRHISSKKATAGWSE
jgi:hypothetical protein